jgi:DNA-binding CsgD family transcriptional regulator/tetratricopeptide (TPR) repeat protein
MQLSELVMVEITQNSTVGRADGLGESDWLSDPFVGRRRELVALSRLIEGEGPLDRRSALVEGVVGVGKTRLVSEALATARRQGTRVLHAACYHVPVGGPFFPFVQAMEQVGSLDEGADLISPFPNGPAGGDGWPTAMADPRPLRHKYLRSLCGRVLRAVDGRRTVLVIEDVHWADVESLLLLNTILDADVSNLVIVCTARTDEQVGPDACQLIRRIEQKSARLEIGGLAQAEARELLDALGGRGRITEDEFQQLYAFAEGNPLLLRELYCHLDHSGLLDDHAIQEALRRTKTPDRLTHVIDLRLRALRAEAPDALRILGPCAVAGTEFSLALATAATGEDEPAVESRLELAVHRRILGPVDSLAEPRYRFLHPLFATRLSETLSAAERGKAHRRLAEAGHAGRVRLSPEELATHHAFGLRRLDRSVRYCRDAAERAERLLAFETAATFWELAVRCASARPADTRAELHRCLGWALWAAGKWSSAAAAWVEAVQLYESSDDRSRVAELALALGDLYRWQQNLEHSTRWLNRALDLYPIRSHERARALALLGNIRAISDDPKAALPLLQEAEGLLKDSFDVQTAYWLSYGYLTSGPRAKGYSIAKAALARVESRSVDSAASLLAWTLFHCEFSELRPGAARRYARMLRDAAAASTDSVSLANSFLCDALLLAYDGRWDEVLRLCERWMSKVRLLGPYQVATARVIWAEARLALGDLMSARRELERALPHLERMRPLAGLHLARACVRLGAPAEAQALIESCPEDVLASPRFTTGRVMLGEVVSNLDLPEAWKESYEVLRHDRRRLAVVYSPIAIQRVLGRLACRLGFWPRAIEHFDSALHDLETGKARWEIAQTCLDYAEMRERRGRKGDRLKADALRSKARGLLAEMGLSGDPPTGSQPFPWDNRSGLTARELEVLQLVARGLRNPEIADALTISRRTVERHIENIFLKTGVTSRVQAVLRALEDGLIGHDGVHSTPQIRSRA